MSLVPGAERLGHLHDRVVRHRPALQHQRVLARQPLRGVRLQVHRGVDEHLAALVIVGHLGRRLAEHVEERGQDVERLAACSRSGPSGAAGPRHTSPSSSDSGLCSIRAYGRMSSSELTISPPSVYISVKLRLPP